MVINPVAKHFFVLVFVALIVAVHGQDQSGFISIDCGISDNSSYKDVATGINYVSDSTYIDTGVNKSISSQYITNSLAQQFTNVRSFPQGTKNCYTIPLSQVAGQTKYLVRARFMYGNYDAKNQIPQFDLYLGVDYWDTVVFTDSSTVVSLEMIHVFSSAYTYICLVNTGKGTPFVSVLEFRLVSNSIYETVSGSLALGGRFDMRSSSSSDQPSYRYQDDAFDRIWYPPFTTPWSELSVPLTTTISQNIYKVPSKVLATAVTPQDLDGSIMFNWTSSNAADGYYTYMHFSELQNNQSREFNIKLNDVLWLTEAVQVPYLQTYTVYSTSPSISPSIYNFSLEKTSNSTLPPILNALEIYMVHNLLSLQTNEKDVGAIKNVKSVYGVTKNWQGDPCSPATYIWDGITCTNDSSKIPRIISLNLSLSGLKGQILNSISNLEMLQSLDLSNNSLSGNIPVSITQLQSLKFLKLSGNNLSGTVPSDLISRSKSGSLTLSVEGNPNLCASEPCTSTTTTTPKKKNNVIIIVVSIVSVFVVLIALALLWVFIIKRRRSSQQQVSSVMTDGAFGARGRDAPLMAKKQQFTYSEVLSMTDNFQRALGKGGFGTVYHGHLDDAQVAVKMLSASSGQGYKQFKAEADLLMRVHHRNLTSLVGYCDEGEHMGLIYEYMENGDLQRHLSERKNTLLSWKVRVEIALDAAQGLEYLHTGCRPPIIHRDVKTTNILLDQQYHAKLADFGLSKAFPTDGSTHVSTTFAGTPGYIDPEFRLNEKSDVFSFGVVLLELITGEPAISRNQERLHITVWVGHMLRTRGNVGDVIDPSLGGDYDQSSAWKAVDVAMECVSDASAARPTMNTVVIELKQCLNMENQRMLMTKKGNYQQSEPDYESTEMSILNIGTTDASPLAR